VTLYTDSVIILLKVQLL